MQPAKEIRVPDNQLRLTDAQLEEEIAKMLTANNPEAPKALTRFNQKEHCYKAEAMIEQTMLHYSADGWLLHGESEDAKKQLEQQKYERDAQSKFKAEVERAQVRPVLLFSPKHRSDHPDTYLFSLSEKTRFRIKVSKICLILF